MSKSGVALLSVVALMTACGPALHTGAVARPAGFETSEISVATRGSGPDLILIHGLAGDTGVWSETAGALASHYKLHLVQIHGFGGAARTSTDTMVSRAVANDIARYIREMRLARPALIGHSMGGTIAMMVAARNAGLVGRVMVVDVPPFLGATLFGQPTATPDELRPMADQLRTQILRGEMLTEMISSMTRSDAHRQKLLAYAAASDLNTIADAMHELILTDMRPELSRIVVPLTVMYEQRANVPIPPEQFDKSMRQMYSNAPDATFVRIEDSNHYIQLDQPTRFVAEVEAFMKRGPAQKAKSRK